MTKIGPTVLVISAVVATTLVALSESVQANSVTLSGGISVGGTLTLVGDIDTPGGTVGTLQGTASGFLNGPSPPFPPEDFTMSGNVSGPGIQFLNSVGEPFLAAGRNTPGPVGPTGPNEFSIPAGQLDIPLTVSAFVFPSGFNPSPGSTTLTVTVPDGLSLEPATALPAALPLFATGLGALGLLCWRRKRKARVSLLGAA